jgi:hypothetical protein
MEPRPCPFCDFADSDAYFLTQHVELCHPENGESPFIARESPDPARPVSSEDQTHTEHHENAPQDDTEEEYIDCPHDCGESLLTTELQSHLDMHVAEGIALEDAAGGSSEEAEAAVEADDEYYNIEANFSTDLPRALRNRQSNKASRRRTQPLQSAKPQKKGSIMEMIRGPSENKSSSKTNLDGRPLQRLGVSRARFFM